MTARGRFWSITTGTILALAGALLLWFGWLDELEADERPCGGDG